MSKRKICLLHDDDWAGQDVEYSVCDKCKEEGEELLDRMYYEGVSLRTIRDRPAPY